MKLPSHSTRLSKNLTLSAIAIEYNEVDSGSNKVIEILSNINVSTKLSAN